MLPDQINATNTLYCHNDTTATIQCLLEKAEGLGSEKISPSSFGLLRVASETPLAWLKSFVTRPCDARPGGGSTVEHRTIASTFD